MKFKEIPKTREKLVSDPYLNRWFAYQGFTKSSFSKLEHEERNPSLLFGIEVSATKIQEAIDNEKIITVCGDYDADGICGTTILIEGIKQLGGNPIYMIPDRKEGYGLNRRMVTDAFKEASDFLLTVDNGISCHEAISHAKDLGMTVVVTDHHTVPDELPKADAILHPHLGNNPFKDISGATVAYKLIRYMFEKNNKDDEFSKAVLEYFRCLAGITVISDVMPLLDENRSIWKASADFLSKDMEENLAYLLDIAGVDKNHIDEISYGFSICPLLNAVGRLSNAEYGVKFLMSETEEDRELYGAMLSVLNEERKLRQSSQLEEIHPLVDDSQSGIVVFNEEIVLDEGLVGIISGRLCQQYKKPTIVFTKTSSSNGDVIWKASARSTEDVNIYDVLKSMSQEDEDLFINFGGHAGAAGMSIPYNKKVNFESLYYKKVSELTVEYEQAFIKIPETDIPPFLDEMKPYAPYGQGFPKPCIRTTFSVTNVKCYFKSGKAMVSDGFIDIWMNLDEILPLIRSYDYRLTFTNFGKSLTETITESTKTEYYKPRNQIIQYDLITGITNNYFGGKETVQVDILQQILL